MQLRGHPQVQLAAVRLLRLHAVSLAALDVAVDASLEVLPEFVEQFILALTDLVKRAVFSHEFLNGCHRNGY